jgi:hypothetical protein
MAQDCTPIHGTAREGNLLGVETGVPYADNPMTLRRATLYVGGGSLLVAWFSSAASLSLMRTPRRPVSEAQSVSAPTDGVAEAVHAQARRLKQRLSTAPLPQQPLRNPFAFRPAPVATPSAVRARTAAPQPVLAEPAPPPEPRLELVGIAEHRRPTGTVRTAMVATEANELVMAAIGSEILGRYTVTAIDDDGVLLTEIATGRTRRLALQIQ